MLSTVKTFTRLANPTIDMREAHIGPISPYAEFVMGLFGMFTLGIGYVLARVAYGVGQALYTDYIKDSEVIEVACKVAVADIEQDDHGEKAIRVQMHSGDKITYTVKDGCVYIQINEDDKKVLAYVKYPGDKKENQVASYYESLEEFQDFIRGRVVLHKKYCSANFPAVFAPTPPDAARLLKKAILIGTLKQCHSHLMDAEIKSDLKDVYELSDEDIQGVMTCLKQSTKSSNPPEAYWLRAGELIQGQDIVNFRKLSTLFQRETASTFPTIAGLQFLNLALLHKTLRTSNKESSLDEDAKRNFRRIYKVEGNDEGAMNFRLEKCKEFSQTITSGFFFDRLQKLQPSDDAWSILNDLPAMTPEANSALIALELQVIEYKESKLRLNELSQLGNQRISQTNII